MILLTGGAFSGKSACARRIWQETGGSGVPVTADGRGCSLEELVRADIWDHFPLWVRCGLQEEKDLEGELAEILEKNPGILIVTQEMGCGLVPTDAFDRAFREKNGRLSCDLAARAEEVYLVSCGLPRRIKGRERT